MKTVAGLNKTVADLKKTELAAQFRVQVVNLHFQVCIRLDAITDFPIGVAGSGVSPAPQLGSNLRQ